MDASSPSCWGTTGTSPSSSRSLHLHHKFLVLRVHSLCWPQNTTKTTKALRVRVCTLRCPYFPKLPGHTRPSWRSPTSFSTRGSSRSTLTRYWGRPTVPGITCPRRWDPWGTKSHRMRGAAQSTEKCLLPSYFWLGHKVPVEERRYQPLRKASLTGCVKWPSLFQN